MTDNLEGMRTRREVYLQFIRKWQWPFEVNTSGNIRFHYDSLTYYLMVDPFPGFFRLVFPGFWNMDKCADLKLLDIAANYAMNKAKVTKILIEKDRVDATVELVLSPQSALTVWDRCFDALHLCAREFCLKMAELMPSESDDLGNGCARPHDLKLSLVVFDHRGWRLVEEGADWCRWQNEEGDHCLLSLFQAAPELPEPNQKNLTTIRNIVRSKVFEIGGGIVSIDLAELTKIPAVISIAKYPQHPSGMTYEAELLLVFVDCYYTVRFQCQEKNMTGVRDNAVFKDYSQRGMIKTINDSIQGWIKDPYDSSWDHQARFNLSDHIRFDGMFPGHPLSRVRRYLESFQNTCEFRGDRCHYRVLGRS